MKWLKPVDCSDTFDEISHRRHPGTCQWTISSPEFKRFIARSIKDEDELVPTTAASQRLDKVEWIKGDRQTDKELEETLRSHSFLWVNGIVTYI